MSNWQIEAISRETGQSETVYEGDDYSTVSDTMLNEGEGSADYSRMSLYEDGQLIESHPQPLPSKGADFVGWLAFVVCVLVVLFLMIH